MDISCDPNSRCAEAIIALAEEKLGVKLHAENDKDTLEGHISIFHENNSHQCWVFIYEQDGKHEGEFYKEEVFDSGRQNEYLYTRELDGVILGTFKEIVIQDDPRVKRPANLPTKEKEDLVKIINQQEVDDKLLTLPVEEAV